MIEIENINELSFDDFPNIISICDNKGSVLFCNKSFLEFYEIESQRHSKSLSLFELDPKIEKEAYLKLFEGLFSGVKYINSIYEFNNSGTQKVLNYTIKPIVFKQTRAMLSIGIEITQSYHKEKEEAEFSSRISEINLNRLHKTLTELEKAKKKADDGIKTKREFMANISHEIRTPLNAILGFSQILTEGIHVNSEQKKNIEAINDSAKTLNTIINDVLDFSKIEAGKMTFELSRISLKEVLESIVRIFDSKAKEKSNSLNYSIAPDLPEFIEIDELRLNQVLINIIGNAVKFTSNGKIRIDVNRKKDMIEFVFTDTGIGIAEDKLELIFDSYAQADISTTRKYGGTGLGLSIVKKLVSLQGGSISVISKEGEGSRFEILLPLIEGKESGKTLKKKKFSENLNRKKILVIEDHPINRMLVEQFLKALNTDYLIVNDGEQALTLFSDPETKFDAVLMDIQLPGKSGHEITKILRKDFNFNAPIIALTANAFGEEREKCLESGMNDYLKKPFYIDDLYNILKKHSEGETIKVDLTFLKNYTNNNDQFAKQILDAFVKQTPLLLEDMKNARAQKETIKIKAIAHKLIPSAVYVGLIELENTLKDLETCGDNHSITMNTLVDQVINQCENAMKQIRKEILLLSSENEVKKM